MKRRLLILVICTFPLAAAETIELDPARTTISFTLADILHTVHGTFKLKHGSMQFDATTGKASGEIVVDVASGNSGGAARDKRMHKEVLESARFPDAVFTPDRVSGALASHGESQLDVHGVFEIHGASHDITLHFRALVQSGEITTSTQFDIPYVEWGMKRPGNFLLKVGDKVEMDIHATGHIVEKSTSSQLFGKH
jgi:polyisoprenoid-binding protein YceI